MSAKGLRIELLWKNKLNEFGISIAQRQIDIEEASYLMLINKAFLLSLGMFLKLNLLLLLKVPK